MARSDWCLNSARWRQTGVIPAVCSGAGVTCGVARGGGGKRRRAQTDRRTGWRCVRTNMAVELEQLVASLDHFPKGEQGETEKCTHQTNGMSCWIISFTRVGSGPERESEMSPKADSDFPAALMPPDRTSQGLEERCKAQHYRDLLGWRLPGFGLNGHWSKLTCARLGREGHWIFIMKNQNKLCASVHNNTYDHMTIHVRAMLSKNLSAHTY